MYMNPTGATHRQYSCSKSEEDLPKLQKFSCSLAIDHSLSSVLKISFDQISIPTMTGQENSSAIGFILCGFLILL